MDEKENTRELIVVDVKHYKKVKKALHESEDRYRQLFENVPIGIYRTTRDGCIVDANPALVKMLGYESFTELSTRNLEKEYADAGYSRDDFVKRLKRDGEIIGLEAIWSKKDGSKIHIRENAKLTRSQDGEVFFEGTVEDITKSKQGEEQLRFLSSVAENITDSITVTDADFAITYINNMGEKIFGYTLDELKGQAPGIFNADPMAEQIQQELYKIVSSGKTYLGESLNRRKDGSTFYCEYKVMPLKDSDGKIYAYTSIQRDITDRKEAEAKLLAYQEQLRALTSEMMLVEERERRRIASELHDQIGQNLALCKLKVAALEKILGDDGIKGELAVVRRLLECSIQDARSLIFDLSPPILYELGFSAALEWLAERIQEQFHVAVEFESRFRDPELKNDQQVILFQVVRELLINVGKHARASQAKIILSHAGPSLKIQVNDDGVGFDASQIFAPREQNSGFGFFSMRERLNYLGGGLEVKSRPGQGSQIILTVPQKGSGVVPKKENS